MASFRKSERLNDKRAIDALFDRRSTSFKHFPLLFLLRSEVVKDRDTIQVLVSVPKKRLRKAVHRNLMKRRIRAAYQSVKEQLSDVIHEPMAIGFVYLAGETMSYDRIQHSMVQFVDELSKTGK
ncbi:MAG: ribonuclease P protein component [Bacteroidetes bacterium]|nr:ribonuclease P protein component [Bacteroidota bacterium]